MLTVSHVKKRLIWERAWVLILLAHYAAELLRMTWSVAKRKEKGAMRKNGDHQACFFSSCCFIVCLLSELHKSDKRRENCEIRIKIWIGKERKACTVREGTIFWYIWMMWSLWSQVPHLSFLLYIGEKCGFSLWIKWNG